MRTYSSVASDLTPGQLENIKQEFRIGSGDGFGDRAKVIAPILDDEAVVILYDEFTAEAAARGE